MLKALKPEYYFNAFNALKTGTKMTKLINLGSRSEKIRNELLQDIENGIYTSNSRLPTERELCDRFKVSRNTVRKAIQWLANEHKIEIRKNSGAFISPQEEVTPGSKTISVMFQGKQELLHEIQRNILEKGYIFSFFSQSRSDWDPGLEEIFLKQVLQQRHQALLAFCNPKNEDNLPILAELQRNGVKVIHTEYCRPELPHEYYVLPDYTRAGRVAAVELILAGYDRCFFAGFEKDGPSSTILANSFLGTLEDHGKGSSDILDMKKYDKDANYFELREHGEGNGLKIELETFIKNIGKNSGILCGSTFRAQKLIQLLQDNGLKVPEEVGVIAVDISDQHPISIKADTIEFDRLKIYQKAISEIIDSHDQGIHELIPPLLIKNGTVRKRS